jgi:L-fucose isomerase-like protein
MNNIPQVNIGLVAVSRDCFPIELSRKRRDVVFEACQKLKLPVTKIDTIIENEKDALKALKEITDKKVNALAIYLGNFGPEGPTTILMQKFGGACMLTAAAEETQENLIDGRGDAYCGMLNASYNTGLRKLRPYIPEFPVGTAPEVAKMIADFVPIARVYNGVKQLKIFAFGPRPHDFLACNAPIKPLYDLGVEVMENSELDLYKIFTDVKDNNETEAIKKDMEKELGKGNQHPGLLPKLARYEKALMDFIENNLGASQYAVMANKCWPAFEHAFEFVPCYINSRLAARGIPVACETDIYGALSEYMLTCATDAPATLLDINNTVPADMYEANKSLTGKYTPNELFMAFHCGNTCASCMVEPVMKHQLIMKRLMEPEGEPNITRGTLEGQIKPGDITLFRLQSTADAQLRAYVAQGEVLNINPRSFGAIGVFAIKEMDRFYRHVLIEKRYPHHAGIGFAHVGKTLYAVSKMLGVCDVAFPLPKSNYYPNENPF